MEEANEKDIYAAGKEAVEKSFLQLKLYLKYNRENSKSCNLYWSFIRGYFDTKGTISPEGVCRLEKSPYGLLQSIKENSHILCSITFDENEGVNEDENERLASSVWKGANALDFMGRVYDTATSFDPLKMKLFMKAVGGGLENNDRLPTFTWARTIPNAPPPCKSRFSDSGYDLHLVTKIKVYNGVHFYDTGIKVEPDNGFYFDIVGRSSISKTGWMLANNVGIIDCSYRGTIIVALVKCIPDAPEIELPCRLVQMIPRKLILMNCVEVDDHDNTNRGSGGFGSTNTG